MLILLSHTTPSFTHSDSLCSLATDISDQLHFRKQTEGAGKLELRKVLLREGFKNDKSYYRGDRNSLKLPKKMSTPQKYKIHGMIVQPKHGDPLRLLTVYLEQIQMIPTKSHPCLGLRQLKSLLMVIWAYRKHKGENHL